MGIRFGKITRQSQEMLTFLLAEKAKRAREDDGTTEFDDVRTVVSPLIEPDPADAEDDDAAADFHRARTVVTPVPKSQPLPSAAASTPTPPPPASRAPVLPGRLEAIAFRGHRGASTARGRLGEYLRDRPSRTCAGLHSRRQIEEASRHRPRAWRVPDALGLRRPFVLGVLQPEQGDAQLRRSAAPGHPIPHDNPGTNRP